jgi:hypothetical protein
MSEARFACSAQETIQYCGAIEQLGTTHAMEFGMPLQAHDEARFTVPDRLDDLILG